MPHTPAPSMALTDALLFTGETFVEGHALLAQDGQIVDLVPNSKIPPDFKPVSLPHNILAPGFIDCQVNGGDNILFNDQPTPTALARITAAHRKTGTTRLLPTCITDAPEIRQAALAAVREERRKNPALLGIHFEGPHISETFRGIHHEEFVGAPTEKDIAFYSKDGDEIILLTLAPEVVSPDQIEQLVKNGIIVSMGHSAATPDQVRGALKAGATGFTHLFTRMEPLAGRRPGMIGVALDDRNSWCGIIGDAMHVAPELMRLACRAKPEDKLFLVSDCTAPAGADHPEPFMYGGEKTIPDGRVCRNEEGTIAGSMLTLGQCVSVTIRESLIDPERALRMASTIPASFLGLGHKLGKLLPGYKADIVALDHGFNAQSVWVEGVYYA